MQSTVSNLQEPFNTTGVITANTDTVPPNDVMNQNSPEFVHGYSSSETSFQSSSESKEPDKKANSLVWVVLIVLILALVALVSYYFGFSGFLDSFLGSRSTQNQTPTPLTVSTPTPVGNSGELNQNSKKEGKISFSYPGNLELMTYEDGTISVTLWGPTQKENTEFYDGVSLSFKKGALAGKSLKGFVDGRYTNFKEVFETTTPLLETVAEKNGYKFHVKGYVEADYYYVE